MANSAVIQTLRKRRASVRGASKANPLVHAKARRARRNHPERDLQEAVFNFLYRALPVDTFRTSIPGGDRGVTLSPGYYPGTPDILIVWQGRAYFIELKAPKGRVSDSQTWAHVAILGAGANVHVAKSIESVELFLRKHGIPLRATTQPSKVAA